MDSRMYQLYELKETLPQALEELERVIKLQSYMVEVLRNAEDQEILKDFLDEFEDNLQQSLNEKIILEHRQEVLLGLLEEYETNEWMSAIIDSVVTRAFEAVGMSYTSGD